MIRGKLSDEARANTRQAPLFLAERSRSEPTRRAAALDIPVAGLTGDCTPSRLMGRRIADRGARAAQVNLEDVLTVAWPGELCPRCGRGGGGIDPQPAAWGVP